MNLIDEMPQKNENLPQVASFPFDHNECVDNIETVSQKDKQEVIRKNDQKQLIKEQHQISIEQAPTRSDPNIDLN